ncbi:cytochrome c oxidase accessory protein CcoG [Neptuniibacter sp.]|uniref:cytochrome c oxidase accessory protein CcoG n=1 Tax=Neptuniibacter sp. TaxID=1962643 RepID=UPI00261F8A9F|nr:cytochrome c oxidase accessory protein CcoG [Neptuniibacter sp.]MCP4596298.1 cytochrome c oxidase accessory protein CcoG [Neptuniibacter sp.]
MSNQNPNSIPITTLPSSPRLPGNGKFHVRLTEGFFQNLRRLISWPLIALFFGMVWVEIDDKPAVLFDFPAHSIWLLGTELSWYDLPVLSGLLISGASLLFFMAVGWGRVWCGFACPQSIWTWIFIRIEDLTEGKAAQRSKEEQASLSGSKLLRRITKHTLWFAVALMTAVTFSGYFVPIETLITQLISAEASLFTLSWIISMTLLTYLNAGLVREKVCLHMCPYSRFQGVMFDENTLTVSYDKQRGEPRTHLRGDAENSGDCVDCNICVQVCPTGIDIRDGLQAACIDCAACIDACDTVMQKLGRKTGLIGFYSEKKLERAPSPSSEQSVYLRPRLIAYLSLCVISIWGVTYGLQNRTELLINIEKERGQLFQLSGNQICNNYHVELESFSPELQQLRLHVTSDHATKPLTLRGPNPVLLNNQYATEIYTVCAEEGYLSGSNPIAFNFTQGEFSGTKQSTFIAP